MALLYKPNQKMEKVTLSNGIRLSYKDLQDKVGGPFQIYQCPWSYRWLMVVNIKSMEERKNFNKLASIAYNADSVFRLKRIVTKLYGTCMLVEKRALDKSLNYV